MRILWDTYLPISYIEVGLILGIILIMCLITFGFKAKSVIVALVTTLCIWQVPCVVAIIVVLFFTYVIVKGESSRRSETVEPITYEPPVKRPSFTRDEVLHSGIDIRMKDAREILDGRVTTERHIDEFLASLENKSNEDWTPNP